MPGGGQGARVGGGRLDPRGQDGRSFAPMFVQKDGNSPLCSIGHRLLGVRCSKGMEVLGTFTGVLSYQRWKIIGNTLEISESKIQLLVSISCLLI